MGLMKKIEKELDDMWSSLVKLRADYTCEYSNNPNCFLNSHHIIEGRTHLLRWNLDNGICLDSRVHSQKAHSTSNAEKKKFIKWLQEYKGIDTLHNLINLKWKLAEFTDDDLLELKEKFNRKIKEYQE